MEVLTVLRTVAPEFNGVSDEIVRTWIELTAEILSKTAFGSQYTQALAYLTAHRMKMAGLGEEGAFGSLADRTGVVSYSEGATSVSFGNNTGIAGAESALSLTTYGAEYLRLKQTIIPIMVRRDLDGRA